MFVFLAVYIPITFQWIKLHMSVVATLTLILALLHAGVEGPLQSGAVGSRVPTTQSGARQLLAVRGEVTKIESKAKGVLLITVSPRKEFAQVTVFAHENDVVGRVPGRGHDQDLFGLLAGDSGEDENITAAELSEGDVVSVIYDPQLQNRVLEIYVR